MLMLGVLAPLLQRYVHGPPAVKVALSVTDVPLQAAALLTVTIDATASVTVPLAVALHPVAVLLTVTVYVPIKAVVILAVVAPVLQW
jgi:hypothetical protein